MFPRSTVGSVFLQDVLPSVKPTTTANLRQSGLDQFNFTAIARNRFQELTGLKNVDFFGAREQRVSGEPIQE